MVIAGRIACIVEGHGEVEAVPVLIRRIAEEVVQHLTALMLARVKVRIEIEAEVPGGVPDNVVRTVTENCRTLRFKDFVFEEA